MVPFQKNNTVVGTSLPVMDPTDTVVKADKQSVFKLACAKTQTTTADGNGSLIQTAPGEQPANGERTPENQAAHACCLTFNCL
ncbi:MAG: hypothetical protein CVU39_11875 [Chloroflexi bacterium HGW-Chloroflexi-10]|nr:MAG: hypothetical protein CVU39_11875 [Chloroflexi bacterium HGW-Chloroflexi-10]